MSSQSLHIWISAKPMIFGGALEEIPNENNLRPIVIGSVMVKMLESVLLNDSKNIFL